MLDIFAAFIATQKNRHWMLSRPLAYPGSCWYWIFYYSLRFLKQNLRYPMCHLCELILRKLCFILFYFKIIAWNLISVIPPQFNDFESQYQETQKTHKLAILSYGITILTNSSIIFRPSCHYTIINTAGGFILKCSSFFQWVFSQMEAPFQDKLQSVAFKKYLR